MSDVLSYIVFLIISVVVIGATVYAFYKRERARVDESQNLVKKESKKCFGKKTVVAICIILSISLVALGFVNHRNNRWKNDLDVKFVGYIDGYSPYYRWEITNETGKTLKNVTVVFQVDNFGDGKGAFGFDDFKIDKRIGNLRVGETATVALYWNRVKAEAEEKDISLLMASADILRIIYN